MPREIQRTLEAIWVEILGTDDRSPFFFAADKTMIVDGELQLVALVVTVKVVHFVPLRVHAFLFGRLAIVLFTEEPVLHDFAVSKQIIASEMVHLMHALRTQEADLEPLHWPLAVGSCLVVSPVLLVRDLLSWLLVRDLLSWLRAG